jgi:hypothetical protein
MPQIYAKVYVVKTGVLERVQVATAQHVFA